MAGKQVRRIDQHPKRNQIIDALLAGQSSRAVAKLAGVSHTQVADYKRKVVLPALKNAGKTLERNNVPEEIAEKVQETVALTKLAAAENPVLTRIEKKYERYDRWIDGAEKKEDFRTCASIDGAETKALELQARMLGLIDAPVSTTNIAVVLLASDQRQAPARQAIPDAEVIDITPVTR